MNEKTYRRLCEEDRKVIYNMNQAGFCQAEISRAIGFSQGTISKELSRNSGQKGYRPIQAHRFACERQREKPSRPRVMTGPLKDQVDARLLCNIGVENSHVCKVQSSRRRAMDSLQGTCW